MIEHDSDGLADEEPEGYSSAELSSNTRVIPTIELVPGVERPVVDQIIPVVARHPNVYQRNGGLVQLLAPAETEDAAPCPTISPLKTARVRELIADSFRFTKPGPKFGNPIQSAPPPWLYQELEARDQWDHVRALEGVVTWPAMRADGTFITEPGYDNKSCIYYAGPRLAVAECPSEDAAKGAAKYILDLVREFPFQDEAHEAAWLAYPLTIIARTGLDCSPAWVFDAPTPGSGKTLLAELGARVVTGRNLPRLCPSDNDDENRKRITSLAIEAESICLIDNIVGSFGGASFDAAMTGPEWKDRILGTNKTVRVPLRIVWAISGNNITIKGDMGRRVIVCRLSPKGEKPDERSFTRSQADLLELATNDRRKYLEALVTILRHAQARDPIPLKPWGSFDRWTHLIRKALVLVGLPDPAVTRDAFRQDADVMGEVRALALRRMFEKVFLLGETNGRSCREILDLTSSDADIRELLAEMCGAVDAKHLTASKLGYAFRKLKDRNLGGLTLKHHSDSQGEKKWLIEKE